MQVIRKFFPEVIEDNQETYLNMLISVIESVDELSHLQITKLPNGYQFRLSASTPQYNNPLIKEILHFNNVFKIQLDLSKSIKSSSIISFKILM
jgi:hypothetical protein